MRFAHSLTRACARPPARLPARLAGQRRPVAPPRRLGEEPACGGDGGGSDGDGGNDDARGRDNKVGDDDSSETLAHLSSVIC
jgi:hypothetical protein